MPEDSRGEEPKKLHSAEKKNLWECEVDGCAALPGAMLTLYNAK